MCVSLVLLLVCPVVVEVVGVGGDEVFSVSVGVEGEGSSAAELLDGL